MFFTILGQQSIFSETLRQVKKQHFKVKFWKLGSLTIWHNMTCVQFVFFSHITPPYLVTNGAVEQLLLGEGVGAARGVPA